MAADAFLEADWPRARQRPGAAPRCARARAYRLAPFDRFNLGLRSGDEPAHALENRQSLRAELALPKEPVWLQQVHGIEVVRIGATNRKLRLRKSRSPTPA